MKSNKNQRRKIVLFITSSPAPLVIQNQKRKTEKPEQNIRIIQKAKKQKHKSKPPIFQGVGRSPERPWAPLPPLSVFVTARRRRRLQAGILQLGENLAMHLVGRTGGTATHLPSALSTSRSTHAP